MEALARSFSRQAREVGLEWSLFQNGSVVLYHRPKMLQDDLSDLAHLGYVMHLFNCRRWQTEADLHEAVGKALRFPDYAYEGRNLRAFNDRLVLLADGTFDIHLLTYSLTYTSISSIYKYTIVKLCQSLS